MVNHMACLKWLIRSALEAIQNYNVTHKHDIIGLKKGLIST